MANKQDPKRDPPPAYSTVVPAPVNNPGTISTIPDGPLYLPPLVKGQQVQNGPYTVTITDSMVALRDRQNQEIYRAWLQSQRRRNLPIDPDEPYIEEFKNSTVRRIFVQRVFGLLFLQFLFTTLYIAFFMFHQPANIFIKTHWYLWVIAMVGFIFSYCSISLSQCGRRQSGLGIICLSLLTLTESHLSAYISVHYQVEAVLIAMGSTTIVAMFIAFVATCCKFDFTKHTGLLSILSFLTLITMILLIITSMFTPVPMMMTLFGALGALIFSLYLYFDIQTIMGGRTIQINPDEIIFATTQIYVDLIGLYRYLLIFVGASDRA
ncbi:hypothetical protein HCN44_004290 [Aphidius gifuensis]|uniref:Uncharacterized protein n=1 Tax=Aphidius gifuensis TaxID=684658 RepID=A0A835CUY9_APHGI|nr:protein lifeguard 3-like [Aphidius gifuensis]KAF7994818.1 hypothetical protein HCN44_004290 [Aphidius gifuensis]